MDYDAPTPSEMKGAAAYGWLAMLLVILGVLVTAAMIYRGEHDATMKELALEVGVIWFVFASAAAIAGVHSKIGCCVLCLIVAALIGFWGYIWWTTPDYMVDQSKVDCNVSIVEMHV